MKEAFSVKLQNNIRAYPKSKTKPALINWEISAYWEEYEQNEALGNKFGFVKYSWGSGCSQKPGKFCNFFPHLETVFPALKLRQICYVNMNISFS